MMDDPYADQGPREPGADPVETALPGDGPVVRRTGDQAEPAHEDAGGQDGPSDGSLLAFLRELPILILVAIVLAFLLRTFVVQVFYIPSGSMEPTLQVNDRMVVEKLTYLFRDPRRGEVVVFEGDEFDDGHEGDNGIQKAVRALGQFLGVVPVSARDFVKRVIGLPGDEVVIEEGVVKVNGAPLEEPYVAFEDGRSDGPFNVPEDKLFVLGDNRPNSSDSRFSLGYIDQDQVVGRAVVVIWPPEHVGTINGADHGSVPAPTGS